MYLNNFDSYSKFFSLGLEYQSLRASVSGIILTIRDQRKQQRKQLKQLAASGACHAPCTLGEEG